MTTPPRSRSYSTNDNNSNIQEDPSSLPSSMNKKTTANSSKQGSSTSTLHKSNSQSLSLSLSQSKMNNTTNDIKQTLLNNLKTTRLVSTLPLPRRKLKLKPLPTNLTHSHLPTLTQPSSIPYTSNIQETHASTSIQRIYRGYITRLKLWRGPSGLAHIYTIVRIQCFIRCANARHRICTKINDRNDDKTNRIIALYHGYNARQLARKLRFKIWNNAAVCIQTNLRTRAGNRLLHLQRELRRFKKCVVIQKVYRGHLGRVVSRDRCSVLEEGRREMLRVLGLHHRNLLMDSLYMVGRYSVIPSEHSLLKTTLILFLYTPSPSTCLPYIHLSLQHYSSSPLTLFTHAIITHYTWSINPPLNLPKHDLLDEGIQVTRIARLLDEERECYKLFEVMYFMCAIKSNRDDPVKMCKIGIMLSVVYGSFDSSSLTPMQRGGYNESNKRCTKLFKRAIEIDGNNTYPVIRTVSEVYFTMYKFKRELLFTKVKSFTCSGDGDGDGDGERKRGKRVFVVKVYGCEDLSADADADADGVGGSFEGGERRKILIVAEVKKSKKAEAVDSKGDGDADDGDGDCDDGDASTAGSQSKKFNVTDELAITIENKETVTTPQPQTQPQPQTNSNTNTNTTIKSYIPPSHQLTTLTTHFQTLLTSPVTRELTIHESEWLSLLPSSIQYELKQGRPMKAIEGDVENRPMEVVAGFIVSRLCLRTVHCTFGGNSGRGGEKIRVLVLKVVQGVRDKCVSEVIEDNAGRMLQRVIRGFQGRSQILRLLFLLSSQSLSASVLTSARKQMSQRRQKRALCAALIQSRIKGRVWRRRLSRMTGAALVIQKVFRGYTQRQSSKEEERKKLEGARVDAVFKRGREISGRHLVLTVSRCGLSFKFVGQSEALMETFYGYVYREQTLELVEKHNATVRAANERKRVIAEDEYTSKFGNYKEKDDVKNANAMQQMMSGGLKFATEDDTEVKVYHYDRILHILLNNLALVEPIKSTSELTRLEGSLVIICDVKYGASAAGRGILDCKGQKRGLRDQRKAIVRYEQQLVKKKKEREMLGL